MIIEFKNEIFSIKRSYNKRIIGEVISINEKETTIQVYESTSGLKPK